MEPGSSDRRHRTKSGRILYLCLGLVFLAIGIVGVFLPILPTTPFVLVAGYCFSRSSDRLHNWLMSHHVFGPLIEQWREHRAIPLKGKIIGLTSMVASGVYIGSSQTIPLYGKASAIVILIAAGAYVATRKNAR